MNISDVARDCEVERKTVEAILMSSRARLLRHLCFRNSGLLIAIKVIEVKASRRIDRSDLRGLFEFRKL